MFGNLFSQNFKPENNLTLNYRQIEFSWPQIPNSNNYKITIDDINSDLSYFGNIIPCGIVDKKVTSLEKEIGRKMDFDEVKNKVKSHLVELFGMEIILNE